MPATPTTRWSLVLASRGEGGSAREALEALCLAYRPVLLSWFRSQGDPARAEDQTQAFFLHFLEQRLAERADARRGSFRAFLFTAADNHRRQAWRDARAGKRDGGFPEGDEALAQLADPQPDAAEAFDREWALLVVARARARLSDEATRAGKAALFDAVRPFLSDTPDADDYARIASSFGLSTNTLAVAVKRLRERLRALVRRELADTLPAGADLDAELAWLKRALRGD